MPFGLKDCAAALLCGGQSRRMGYDKAFLRLADNRGYLLEYLAERLQQRFGEVILITDRPQKLACLSGLSGLPVAQDIVPQAGPLSAICTALKTATKKSVFVLACDMPRLNWEIIAAMAGKAAGYDAVIPQHGRFLEPLYAFYNPRALPIFLQALKQRNLKIRDAFSHMQVCYHQLPLHEGSSALFANINRPEDLSLLPQD